MEVSLFRFFFIFVLVLATPLQGSHLAFADDGDGAGAETSPADDTNSKVVDEPAESTTCPSLESLRSEIDQDEQTCGDLQRQATNCCQNPQSCGGVSVGGNPQLMQLMMTVSVAVLVTTSSPDQMQGMGDICQMFSGLAGAGGSYNGGVNNQCITGKENCSSVCKGLTRKWQDRATSATSKCASYQEMLDAHGALLAKKTRCDTVQANTAVTSQAKNMNSANSGAMQGICNQLMQQPQMQQQLLPLQQMQMAAAVDCNNPMMAQTAACTSCAQNPTSPSCLKSVQDSGSNAAIAENGKQDGPGAFNVPSAVDGKIAQNAQFGDPKAQAASANAITGQGGGFAGGGGGGSPNGDPYGNRQQGGQGYGSGPHYELQGEKGGNGFSGYAQGDGATTGGFAGYEMRPPPDTQSNLDLKRYLPNGSLDPRRKVAGVGSINPDINPRGSDIFQRISDRFRVICASNRLIDCTMQAIKDH
jgi:hypothetical protein